MSVDYIAYQIRDLKDKVLYCNTFCGELSWNTIERLVKHHFDTELTEKGSVIFVDRKNRRVHLNLVISPRFTEAGKDLLKKYQEAQEEKESAREKRREALREWVDSLSDLELESSKVPALIEPYDE